MNYCRKCGKEIKVVFGGRRVFCSDECCKAWYKEHGRIHKNCLICGKPLTGTNKKYCSAECRYQAQLQRQRSANLIEYKKPKAEATPPKKRGRPKKKQSLADINKLARAEGLTYGQYVGKYGL
jgi:predicted nucleic acid-binding Zn ribbon protein